MKKKNKYTSHNDQLNVLFVLEDRDGNAVLLLESGVVLYINSQVLMSTKEREGSSQRGYIDSILF